MKRRLLCSGVSITFAFVVLLCATAHSAMPEPQSKQAKQVNALVDKGAALVASKGKGAFLEFRKKGSAWFQGDLYLFVDDFNGNVLVNPPDPKIEGENIMNMKDAQGKPIIPAFIDLLKDRDSGWADYMWPKPGTDRPSRKLSYVRKVKMPSGEMVFVGAGIYAD